MLLVKQVQTLLKLFKVENENSLLFCLHGQS